MSAELAYKVSAIAAGTIAAQRFIDDLRNDRAVPIEAVDRLRLVMIEHGVDSAAAGAFLSEMAKRCR